MGLGYETMVIICDICKERPLKTTIKVKGVWVGVCSECEPKKEIKDDLQKM